MTEKFYLLKTITFVPLSLARLVITFGSAGQVLLVIQSAMYDETNDGWVAAKCGEEPFVIASVMDTW